MEYAFDSDELHEFFEMLDRIKNRAENLMPAYVNAFCPSNKSGIPYLKFKSIDTEQMFDLAGLVEFDPKADTENVVSFEGDEYWRFGGHEHYDVDIPLALILDENADAIIEAEQAALDERRALAADTLKDQRIAEKRAQLEKLKKELGEE